MVLLLQQTVFTAVYQGWKYHDLKKNKKIRFLFLNQMFLSFLNSYFRAKFLPNF